MIADPTRRKLIELLADGEHPVSELVAHFDISFSAISQQLRILSDANLVRSRREGRSQLYRLGPGRLDPVGEWLSRYAKSFWSKKLQNLDGVLKRIKNET